MDTKPANPNSTAAQDQGTDVSYADAYQPPQGAGAQPPADPPMDVTPPAGAAMPQPEMPAPTPPSAPATQPQAASTPPADPAPSATQTQSSNASDDQSLESQNIFEMLGVSDGTDDQKEEFLDELQHIIWEDFLEHDVKLLITDAEHQELQTIQNKQYDSDVAKQEALVVYLEKLIPDMEEIMLEKALELKADLFKERIGGLREHFEGKADDLAVIEKAELAMQQNQWATAAGHLNTLK